MTKKIKQQPESKLYGRRKGRPLGQERQEAMDTLFPCLDLAPLLEAGTELDLTQIFGATPSPLWLEIGFGNGEHVAGLMARHPDYYFLACEPFINGMAAFLKEIANYNCHSGEGRNLPDHKQPDPGLRRDDAHRNIRVLMDDAMKLCRALPDACLDGMYILNPDPWPKTRHHRRRIVGPENLDVFARILKPGGQLIMTTDVPGLADWMVTHTNNHPAFTWTARRAADWQTPPEDWITTRYEVKGANGAQKMCYLFFEKNR